ncbi:MAG: class I SAM-dependent methyltransferase [Candidatus Binataceae bacterium]
MKGAAPYVDFWRRKQLLAEGPPEFAISRWWMSDALCDIERIYFDALKGAATVLDVGAGDLRLAHRFRDAGFAGRYDTLEPFGERSYTYSNLSQVNRTYDAVLFIDVIEHLTLDEGLGTLGRLAGLLNQGGVLIVQTPNARCIRNPLSWDMTHLHCYNGPDLWAYLRCIGLDVEGCYRIVFGVKPSFPLGTIAAALKAFLIARVIGSDYADNIALIARKSMVKAMP